MGRRQEGTQDFAGQVSDSLISYFVIEARALPGLKIET
jgi:hypothetical protein